MTDRRITVIARQPFKPELHWNQPAGDSERLTFVDSVHALKSAMGEALENHEFDVERAIIDRSAKAEDFLDVLATMPQEFAGDVLFIRDDGSGFLSATGRGCDRVLYGLASHDVRFYLATHDLVSLCGDYEMTA